METERALLDRNVQRFRGGLVSQAHRLCVSLNSRLESNKEEKKKTERALRTGPVGQWSAGPTGAPEVTSLPWFGIWCFGFRVSGFGFGVWYLVFGVWCLVFGVWCLVFGTKPSPCTPDLKPRTPDPKP